VTLQDASHGLALAVGALPAAAVGVAGSQRSRHAIVIVGLCIGLGLCLGPFWDSTGCPRSAGFLLTLGSAVL